MAIEEEPAAGIPEWVVTFGDMMSLLLTFFIILLSMSEMKEEDAKFQAMVEALQQQFGHDSSMASLAPGERKPRNSNLAKLAAMGRAMRKDTKQGGAKVKAPVGDNQRPKVIRPGERTPSGIYLVFEEHSLELTEKHKIDLQYAAEMFGGKSQKLEIRGHTSRKPPPQGTLFELGYRRAVVVKDYLVHELGIERQRIVISSAGPYEPAHRGTDLLKQRENARVEVYMLNKTVEEMSGSSGEDDAAENPFDLEK